MQVIWEEASLLDSEKLYKDVSEMSKEKQQKVIASEKLKDLKSDEGWKIVYQHMIDMLSIAKEGVTKLDPATLTASEMRVKIISLQERIKAITEISDFIEKTIIEGQNIKEALVSS
jgi:hypothetical protein